MLKRVKFVVRSRGIANSAERMKQVASRFGLSAGRMERRLTRYADVVAEAGCRPSFPITARVLARNPQVAIGLLAKGVELCVHGLVHNDLSELPPETQEEQIEAACAVFRKHGVAFTGFRSPYLRYNAATLAAVEKAGFAYDSNLPFYWQPLHSLRALSAHQRDGLERGLRFYDPRTHPQERSLPRLVGNLAEIPVSLPDDEILLDRMSLSPERVAEVWVEMAEAALARGELLTLQLHPERLSLLEGALREVLRTVGREGACWLATLGEIAAWWRARVAGGLVVETATDGTHQVRTSGTVLGGLRLVVPATGSQTAVTVPGTVACPHRPLVGLDPEAAPDLRVKIREIGYFVDITVDKRMYALYVESRTRPDDVERMLSVCDRPLLKEGIWPAPHTCAFAATGDIDCLTIGDFLRRLRGG